MFCLFGFFLFLDRVRFVRIGWAAREQEEKLFSSIKPCKMTPRFAFVRLCRSYRLFPLPTPSRGFFSPVKLFYRDVYILNSMPFFAFCFCQQQDVTTWTSILVWVPVMPADAIPLTVTRPLFRRPWNTPVTSGRSTERLVRVCVVDKNKKKRRSLRVC